MDPSPERFGCAKCLPDEAEAAAQCWFKVPVTAELIAESHFSVKLRRCDECQQQFVSVFAELIDWENGDDPQQSCAMPIVEFEAARLRKTEERELERVARELAPDRRSISTFWPSGGAQRAAWTRGMVIGPHD